MIFIIPDVPPSINKFMGRKNVWEYREAKTHHCQLIAVEGSIQTRKYQDKDGNNRTAFEVVANQVHFAESKKEGNPTNTFKPDINPDNGFQEFGAEDDLPFD